MKTRIIVRAPINIAVIKYWGKSDVSRMLPCNDSISMTLDSSHLFTETEITLVDEEGLEDEFVLEDHPQLNLNDRIKSVLQRARELAARLPESSHLVKYKLKIKSRNSVPTASGLASSASGIAALAYGLINLFNLHGFSDEITEIARLGSGSACRSLFGGFVLWSGTSVHQIKQISPLFMEELNGFVIVLDSKKKAVSSSEGMQRTVQNSSLFQQRISHDVPQRIKRILEAIKSGDFSSFAELTMRDSNSMHACCLDSFPPFMYLSAQSFLVIEAVHEYNNSKSEIRLGYTFDAGPNAVIFGLKNDPQNFINMFKNRFNSSQIIPWKIGNGPEIINFQ